MALSGVVPQQVVVLRCCKVIRVAGATQGAAYKASSPLRPTPQAFSPVLDAILQLRTLRPTLHAQSVEHDAFFVEDSVEVLGPGEGEGEEAEDAALSDDDVAGPGAEEQAAAEGAQAAQGTGGGDV